ncbi:hypothetical protein N7G274_004021 [Stereocaulon virgatum]|uniref:Uncharacterized protein n=1 Tax=Stereocaulon virgatum TaxID=373712 RepID=A0ABR4AD17_9LECA
MGTALLFFRFLAIAATIVQAYPAGEETRHSRSRHHLPVPTSRALAQPAEKHVAASPNPTLASSASAQSAMYAADAAGPPTTLSPNQIKINKEEAQIAAEGLSMYRAGTASTASVASASAAAATAAVNCNDGTWAPTLANYNKAKTDQNLKKWWFGGEDTDNNTFTGIQEFQNQLLDSDLGCRFHASWQRILLYS